MTLYRRGKLVALTGVAVALVTCLVTAAYPAIGNWPMTLGVALWAVCEVMGWLMARRSERQKGA